MSKKIEIRVSPTGVTTIEAIGFKGVGCKEATAPLVSKLLGKSGLNMDKSEIHEMCVEADTRKVGNRWES